jgi:cell division protein FtsQ
VILGYQQQEQRLERFIKAYSKLKPSKKINQITFDMRYPKGFTLSY